MSFRKKNIKGKIQRIKPKKSIFKKIWFWVVFLFIISLSIISYIIFFYSGLQIKEIKIFGNEKIKTDEIQEFIFNKSNINLIDFLNVKISSKSILLINKNKINKETLEKFPNIENIKINIKLPQTLILNIKERKPIGIYSSKDNQHYLIDKNGIIFERLLTNIENYTIFRQTTENNQLLVGEQAVSNNIINNIYKIKETFEKTFHINLKEILIDNSIKLKITTNEKWIAYFNLDQDIDSQITKLNLLFKNEISEEKRKNLRYIDLRPEGRAIVCDNKDCGQW